MNKDLVAIFEYLEREKGIKRELVVNAIEESLQIAARKSIQGLTNVSVSVNAKTGEIEVFSEKEIVENVEIPEEEIALDIAREIDPDCQVGQWIKVAVTPENFGRIAAQTARQVISQKLRTAERDVIYEEYRHRVNEMVSGTVKRIVRGGTLIVDLGKVEGVLPERFYPKLERYGVGQRVQAMILEVRDTENGGAEVILTRSHPELVAQLFMQEVPELIDGIIEIKKVVRDAGYRTKIAVASKDSKIDPLGACVGVRGTRVKNIIRELNNEKIDIIPYSNDPIELLKNALEPVVIKKLDWDKEANTVTIVVDDEDYPTVLGKKGMNARLNAKLIDQTLFVKKASEHQKEIRFDRQRLSLSDDPALDQALEELEGLNMTTKDQFVLDSLKEAGFDTLRKVLTASPEELKKITSITQDMIEEILDKIRKTKD
jgi:transcription termination/antitermination protein NusA